MHTVGTPGPSVDSAFSISSRRLDHGIALDLSGEIDLATAPIVEDELRRAEQAEDLIVLNLEAVEFIDSTGIRTVIAAHQRLRGRGASLRIVNVPEQVQKLFKLVGIFDHLEIDDRLDAGHGTASSH